MSVYTQRVEIAPDHPCLAGHFPDHPIVPGVLLLQRVVEAAAQGFGAAAFAQRIHQVKFLSPLKPGEAMDITLEGEPAALRFRCECGGRLLAQGSLSL